MVYCFSNVLILSRFGLKCLLNALNGNGKVGEGLLDLHLLMVDFPNSTYVDPTTLINTQTKHDCFPWEKCKRYIERCQSQRERAGREQRWRDDEIGLRS